MIRVYALTGALALAVVLIGATADAADEKVTIKDIMKKAHGKGGLKASITESIKEKKWDDAAKTVKEWEVLTSSFEKLKPKKGEAESWTMKTTGYNKTLKTLGAAIEKKDAKAATAAVKMINSSCGACHKAHKGK